MQAEKKEHQKIKKVNILFCDVLILFFHWPMAAQAAAQVTAPGLAPFIVGGCLRGSAPARCAPLAAAIGGI